MKSASAGALAEIGRKTCLRTLTDPVDSLEEAKTVGGLHGSA